MRAIISRGSDIDAAFSRSASDPSRSAARSCSAAERGRSRSSADTRTFCAWMTSGCGLVSAVRSSTSAASAERSGAAAGSSARASGTKGAGDQK